MRRNGGAKDRIQVKHTPLFKCMRLKARTSGTAQQLVRGRTKTEGNEEAGRLATEGYSKPQTG